MPYIIYDNKNKNNIDIDKWIYHLWLSCGLSTLPDLCCAMWQVAAASLAACELVCSGPAASVVAQVRHGVDELSLLLWTLFFVA